MRPAPPFGSHAPSAFEARIRNLAHTLPVNYVGRKCASLLLGPAGGRDGRPRDVEIFADGGTGLRARLHPYDNIAEKRVYLTPHHWDPDERALLSILIAQAADSEFRFVDIGANAGLYTLFAGGEARRAEKSFRALCIEPEPVMADRLTENMAFSGFTDQITLKRVAVAAQAGRAHLAVNTDNRGMTRLSGDAGPLRSAGPSRNAELAVEAQTLAALISDWAPARRAPHFLKIDIEGMEMPVLKAFFDAAPAALWPQTIQTEISHEGNRPGALKALVETHGYRMIFENRLNLIVQHTAPL